MSQRLPEVEAFKGFLICLIVLGHGSLFSGAYPNAFNAFYNFHVACYLILPCIFYGRGVEGFQLQQRLIRYGVPQLFFFLLSGVLFLVVYRELTPEGIRAWSGDMLIALFVSSESTYKAASGFGLFWFLPALLALNLLRSAYFIGPKWISVVLLITMVIAHLFIGLIPNEWQKYLPFSLPLVLFLLPLGLIAGYAWNRWRDNVAFKPLALSLFVSCIYTAEQIGSSVALAGESHVYSVLQPFRLLLHDVYLLSAFFGLISIASVMPLWISKGFVLLGQHSLVIFLVHSLVWQSLIRLGVESQLAGLSIPSPGKAFCAFALTMGISVMIALALDHLPRVSAFIFPRDWRQWRAAWQLKMSELHPEQ